jgi:hypothetical protein
MMLIAVAVLTIASIAALIAAMTLDSGVIAGACAGLCVVALLVLIIDARRAPRSPAPEPVLAEEHHHTAGDELFGEHDVQRDLVREERVLSPDMLEEDVPYEEGQRY